MCRRKPRGDAGSVAIEAAIIFPILALMLFGILEFSMVLRDHVALAAATRSGARAASAEPRMASFADDAASAIARAGVAMPLSNIQQLWIYEANAGGYPTNGGSIAATTGNFNSCSTRCVIYSYDGSSQSFSKSSGSWDSSAVNACPGDSGMTNVGVYLKAQHFYITSLFGSSVTLTDHAVLRFEPIPASLLQQSGQCKP